MPRQDVPYGGAICRLKERIAEIWDELGKKLHSINGVEGDAAGDVKIVSGDAAVVVTSDQVNHEIEIALDSSKLPAAAVSSVNGQTGAVALTADDIPSDNGNVQTDLDNLAAADTTLQGNINAETLARSNADSTLQTNINTVTASLPAAAAAAVAADPTVAQLVNDIATAQADITTLDNSVLKTSGNQAYSGRKTSNGMTYGRVGYRIRNTGTNKLELARVPIQSDQFHYFVEIHTRYASLIGRLHYTSDGVGNLTSCYFTGLNYGSDNYTRVYLYPLNGNIIIGIGNNTSTNNYYNVDIRTGFRGAGNEIAIDYSNVGRFITSETPADAVALPITV